MTRPWLVTGAGGMLARDLLAVLAAARVPAVALRRADLDVTDGPAVRAAVRTHRPATVVNCAAWTAVDAAEEHPAAAFLHNAEGPRLLAEACAAAGARLLQPSTDYVFPGDGRTPYAEDDLTGPRTVYGRSKLAGERAVLAALPGHGYVVRTAWLYGAHGRSFVRTMAGLERERETVDVVDDQYGQPTWTADLAGLLVRLGRAAERGTAPPGVYHGTSAGATSWYGLARETFRLLGADPDRVRPVSSAALDRPAPRPAYSVLGHDGWRRAGIRPIGDWRERLAVAVPALLRAERVLVRPSSD
ncbi:dTDP-4-dehydrorhamnose reductase [Streptomyces huiliensis]|uniref:dTDP-4-dehydrorhamnose reductase n=1 Tax=Streptomyces huiliensis TaxID=2876027 RepID=UPI001CBCC9CC|nr:dTDP-4-dehydrorhamnose reductase [Streptomyces huiliensis]MBZ4319380.1 dTDP-4-dehydrorhamnose reductase [Streptomyces huiliensis]